MNEPKHQWSDFDIQVQDQATGHRTVICPVCSHNRKPKNQKVKILGVTFETKGWHCHHCDYSGSLWNGVKNEGDPHGKINYAPAEVNYRKPEFKIVSEYSDDIIEFFKRRGISEETMRGNSISQGMHYMPQVEKEIDTIHFPFKKNGVVVNIKFRGKGKDNRKIFSQTSQAEQIPYGYDDIQHIDGTDENHIIFIVEGEMDKLTLWELGYPNCISPPSGAPPPNTENYNAKLDWLECVKDKLSKAKTVVLALDADEPGKCLSDELARRIGIEKCFTVQYPKDCKDINEVIVKYGVFGKFEALKVFKYLKPFPIVGIITVKDHERELDILFHEGITPGRDVRWKKISNIWKIANQEFTTVTGFPGSGKSEIIEDVVMDFAKRKGERIGIFTPEHPTKLHMLRMIEKYVGKPVKIKGAENSDWIYMTKDEYEDAKVFMNNHIYYIERERGKRMDPETLLERKRQLLLSYGCTLFVDDPYNRLDHRRPKEMTVEEYVSWFLEIYGEFNDDHNCHSFILAHPKNPDPRSGNKKNRQIAYAQDISGGAMWYNKSPNVVSIARMDIDKGTDNIEGDEATTFMTQKIKFKWNGKQKAREELFFNVKNGLFSETKPSEMDKLLNS